MHALNAQLEHAEIGKLRIQGRLPIALQIPRLGAARRVEFDPAAKRDARMVQRVAAVVGARQQERGARVVGKVPGVARQRRHQEQRRAVEIAGDADQRGQRAAPLRLQRRQSAGSGEPHQPLGVGNRFGMGLVGIDGGVRHLGLEVSGDRDDKKPAARAGQERHSPAGPAAALRSLANPSNFMVTLHNSLGRPNCGWPAETSPSLEHIQAINGFSLSQPAQAATASLKAGASCPPSRWSTTTATY
jgi:hypothetical protein